jgi:hypothetical protein
VKRKAISKVIKSPYAPGPHGALFQVEAPYSTTSFRPAHFRTCKKIFEHGCYIHTFKFVDQESQRQPVRGPLPMALSRLSVSRDPASSSGFGFREKGSMKEFEDAVFGVEVRPSK